jgi:hypothetical protein
MFQHIGSMALALVMPVEFTNILRIRQIVGHPDTDNGSNM